MVEKYFAGKIPQASRIGCAVDDEGLKKQTLSLYGILPMLMEEFDFAKALTLIWDVINTANKYIEDSAPWKLNQSGEKDRLATVIYNLLEVLRIISIAVYPFMPKTCSIIRQSLGLKEDGITETKFILSLLSDDIKKAREEYKKLAKDFVTSGYFLKNIN